MKEYISKNFSDVSQYLINAKDQNYKVFYENEASESFEIRGYMTEASYAFAKLTSTGNYVRVNENEKLYILPN